MRQLIFAALILSFVTASAGDTTAYSWMQGPDVVGELVLVKGDEKGRTRYSYNSDITVFSGIELHVEEDWEVVYSEEHNLSQIIVRNMINGETRAAVTETVSGGSAVRAVNGMERTMDRPEISYSYILLFFKPPLGQDEAYSEVYGDMFRVRQTDENTYTMTDTRNREHKFYYNDQGRLARADIRMSVGVLVLVPKE